MRYITFSIILVSCSALFSNRFDQSEALDLIKEHQAAKIITDVQVESSGAHRVLFNDGHYLFIVDSFNRDFTGWLYSVEANTDLLSLKFKSYYIKTVSNRKGQWSEVYGGW